MNAPFTILIVDDSVSVRHLIRKSLESSGFTSLLEAGDGKEALDVLMEHTVNLIISDIHMPKVNGIELLKAILNHSSLKTIPFIVLTSETEDEMFKTAMQAGATDYIKKPFTTEQLEIKIRSVIEWL